MDSHLSYLRKQAAACLRLSRETTDREMAERLRLLAAKYQEKAREAESLSAQDK
jgi:hypothetical protein